MLDFEPARLDLTVQCQLIRYCELKIMKVPVAELMCNYSTYCLQPITKDGIRFQYMEHHANKLFGDNAYQELINFLKLCV